MSHPSANTLSIPAVRKAAIRLEGWGMPTKDVMDLACALNHQLPAFDWCASDASDPDALTLHLVDIAKLAGDTGHAVWNTFGPVEAMRQAREAGKPALAVCRGRFSELPVDRLGVWVASTKQAWEIKLQALMRAIAAMSWHPKLGYQDLPGWRAVQPLTDANLLAITATDDSTGDFPALMRQVSAAAFAHPVALSVAGAARPTVERTLVEAGLEHLQGAAVAPMTLDGVLRVDALVGFSWPAAGQSAA